MFKEVREDDFYELQLPVYILLRYALIFLTYFLFQKDYLSIGQTWSILLDDKSTSMNKGLLFVFGVLFRNGFVILNQVVVFYVILTTNIGADKGIGLILNYTAAAIVVEIDDFAVVAPWIHVKRVNSGDDYLKYDV